MYCKHCGKPNDNDSKFCMYCGGELEPISQPVSETPPQNVPTTTTQPIFENLLKVSTLSRQDLGYLLIALSTVFQIIVWQLYTKLNSNWYDNKPVVAVLNFLFVIDWIIMIIFVKKPVYKVIICIIMLLVVGFNIYIRYFENT